MLNIIKSSIFVSPAHTLVNTVNTVGVMGKGIAQQFKARYPQMYREYKTLCDQRILKIGTLHCWHGPNRWILNFPTKTTWKKPSKIEFIEAGLHTFAQNYSRMGIQSASFPPLGCGNGQLDWRDVRPLMLKYLWDLDIPIFIHEWFEPSGIAEQYDRRAKIAPVSFGEFLDDLHALIDERSGRFVTLEGGEPFRARFGTTSDLEVFLDQKFIIPEEFLATAWAGLQTGLLTPHTFGGQVERYARYILPIVSALPYVRKVPIEIDPRDSRKTSTGFFLTERFGGYEMLRVEDARQCQSL